jgi:hypothetical protein
MNPARLQELGLVLQDRGAGPEAELTLEDAPLLNPLTRRYIEKVQFTLLGERLLAIDPPELVGLPPINLLAVQDRRQLEQHITNAYDTHINLLQRRSSELQAMGVPAQVDPESLQLTATVTHAPYDFLLLADKQGQFRVARTFKGGQEMQGPSGQPFELSEFRERGALAGYLVALLGQGSATAAVPGTDRPAPLEEIVTFAEVAERFGAQARLPPRSALEVLVEMRVDRVRYRFASARLAGRSFRGLLAGPSGKLWAERFELDSFPGPAALLARTLDVPVESVEIVPPGQEG